jgi:hypothetical protein
MRLVSNEDDHETLQEQLQNSIQSTKASIIKGVKARAVIEALGLDANPGVLHGGLIKEIQATAVGDLISTKEYRPTQIQTSQRRLCPTIVEMSSDPSLPEPQSDWIANDDSMNKGIRMASEETIKSLSEDQVAELDISSSVSISDWIKH